MLKTIFHQGDPSRLPALCAIGECLDPDTSHCEKCHATDTHPHTRWWATGILIHPRVVLTAAHSPRSDTILGDRVLLPKLGSETEETPKGKARKRAATNSFPERLLCVQRIHDHPKSKQHGFDARVLILMPAEGLEKELAKRRCALTEFNGDSTTRFHIDGFENLHSYTQGRPKPTTRSRLASMAKDAHRPETHGHVLGHEFVMTPEVLRDGDGDPSEPSAAFGDSGAPVWIDDDHPAARVVGMYVRRSINRPAMSNPDLVVLAWTMLLKGWVEDVMDRYGLKL